MAPPPPPTAITLKVKVPPGYIEGGIDDFNLGSLAVSTTIGAVRQQIQQTVPSHPTPEKQRLLYGGRALVDNEQTLADALNTKRDPEQGEHVIHLLVKGEQNSAAQATSAGAGHRRVASTPIPGVQPQAPQQPQQGQAPAIPPHLQHQHHQQHHQHQHQHQQLLAQQIRQQQQLLQQMAQRNGGMMPPGFAQLPPGMPQTNFAQMIAQGQQQRAAMGMQGLAGQAQQPPQQNGTTPDANPNTQPTTSQEQQHNVAAHSPAANGQQAGSPQPPGQQPQPGQHRPVSGQGFHFEGIGPNGQRVQIHQQTLQIPHAGMPGQQPSLFGGMPPMPQMPGFAPQAGAQLFGQQQPGGGLFGQSPMASLFGQPPQQAQAQAGPSALDRARDNLAEMRRMLDEMRETSGATEEQRNRIASLQERTQSVNDYVDPFHLGGNNAPGGTLFGNSGRRSASPNTAGPGRPQPSLLPSNHEQARIQTALAQADRQRGPLFGNTSLFGNPPQLQPQQQQQPSNPNDVTCYLLSGPQGPQALLFSPQHGTYTGQLANSGLPPLPRPTPTTQVVSTATGQGADQAHRAHRVVQQGPEAGAVDPVAAAAAQHIADGAARQAAVGGGGQPQDPLGPMQGLLNHMWLLLRVLIFAYFVLGSNMGWKRPLALMIIGFGFWMVRAGLFGDGGVLRRWWDGIVRVGPPPPAPGQGQPGGQQQQPAQEDRQRDAGAAAPQGQGGQAARQPMPTPEQVAQRLVNERNQQQNARVQQLREIVRPAERAIALFVASLWPGIGEAHVRAQEQEERRRNEEEVAARRREEEERVKREEEANKEKDEPAPASESQSVQGGSEVVGGGAKMKTDDEKGVEKVGDEATGSA